MTTMNTSLSNNNKSGRRGFTLVELLVVVAVIALLIGLLLPALSKARAAGFAAKGLSTQKQLVLGLIGYGSSADFAIPGINTSGRELQRLLTQNGGARIDQSDSIPTQGWDWITPALAGEVNFPVSRADRMVYGLREYADPAQREVFVAQNINNGDELGAGDAETVKQLVTRLGSIPAPSYFMPAAFQLQGGVTVPPTDNIQPYGQSAEARACVEIPVGYRPRVDKIGQNATKIAIADGHVDISDSATAPKLDVGVFTQPVDKIFGAYASDGAIRKDSLAYPEVTTNNKLSYRHANRMNTVYWDGHGEALSNDDSRNPSLWYPVNSMYKNSNAHSGSLLFFGGNPLFPRKTN